MESTNFATIDFDRNEWIDLVYRGNSRRLSDPMGDIWAVGVGLLTNRESEILRASRAAIFFDDDMPLTRTSLKYINPLNGRSDLPISSYNSIFDDSTAQWTFVLNDFEGTLPTERASVLVGCRFRSSGEWHYAWLRFTRPDTQIQTLFQLDAYDWNPIPDSPIRAGQPPEIPMDSEWLADGITLRLSWPSPVSDWILESTPDLQPPVVWEPHPSSGSYTDIVPEETGRFFRLRRP